MFAGLQQLTNSTISSDFNEVSPSDESEALRNAKYYGEFQGLGEEVLDYDNDELRDTLSQFGVDADISGVIDARVRRSESTD